MKVGDYVRTKYGIAKIIDISCGEDLWFDNDNIFDEDEKEIFRYNKPSMYSNWADNNIIKSSPNIIDLIEVGDYVNGQLVKHIAYFEGVEEPIKKLIFADEYHLIPTEVCEQNEIKSIVTKEQFESMKYEVN